MIPGAAQEPAPLATTPRFAFCNDFVTNLNDALIVAGVSPVRWSERQQSLIRLDLAGLAEDPDARDRRFLEIARGSGGGDAGVRGVPLARAGRGREIVLRSADPC